MFRYSKLHKTLSNPHYWFGLSKTKFEYFPVEKVFIIFICETDELYFVIPGTALQAFIDGVETKGLGEWKIQILPRNHSYLLELTGPKYIDISQFMNNYSLLKSFIDQKNVKSETNNININKDASKNKRWNLNRILEYKENIINKLLEKLDSNKDNINSIGGKEKAEEGIRWYEDKIKMKSNKEHGHTIETKIYEKDKFIDKKEEVSFISDSVKVKDTSGFETEKKNWKRAPVHYCIGDVVQMQKQHPCGGFEWEILRVGMDFRIRCLKCGRQVMMPRPKFEKEVKKVVRPAKRYVLFDGIKFDIKYEPLIYAFFTDGITTIKQVHELNILHYLNEKGLYDLQTRMQLLDEINSVFSMPVSDKDIKSKKDNSTIVINNRKSAQDEQTSDTSTAQIEGDDLSQLLAGPQYIPILTALQEEGVFTIRQYKLRFKQISLMRYLNSKNIYSWQERVKIAEAVNHILGEEDEKEDLPSAPTERLNDVATVENMTVDFSENRNYAYTKPTEFSLHGKTITVQSWADLLVALCNLLITEKPDVVRTLIYDPLISASARAYFSHDKGDLAQPKQLCNGMWVETNFSATDIVYICRRLCTRFGTEINDLAISYYSPGRAQQNQKSQGPIRDGADYSTALPVTEIDNRQLESYLKSRGLSACTIDEMITGANQPPRMRAAIVRAVEANAQIVEIAKGRYIHRSCIVDMEEAAKIMLNILRTQFRQFDGYSNYRLLFDAARIDLSLFMNDNAFEDEATIYSLAKHLFSKEGFAGQHYCFYGNMHIWEQEPDFPQSLKGLLIHRARLAGGRISRAECEAFLDKIKMGQSNFNQAIQAAADSTFIQYDSGEYLLSETLHIDDAWRERVKKALDELFEENDFIILRDISEAWYKKLPELPLGLPWTPLLLQEALYYNKPIGYKTISAPLEQNRDTVAAAIVTAGSDYKTFADVVSAYLCNKMELPQRMSAENLRLLLREAGMIEGNELISNMHKALDDYRFAWSDGNKMVYIQKG